MTSLPGAGTGPRPSRERTASAQPDHLAGLGQRLVPRWLPSRDVVSLGLAIREQQGCAQIASAISAIAGEADWMEGYRR